MNTNDNTLSHHGVLGMKWGVRKSPETLAKQTRKANDVKVKTQRKKISQARRHLSEGELKKAVDRLQTEKKLKDLTNDDISPGRTTAKNIIKQIGKSSLTAAGTAVATYAIKAALEKKFDVKEAAKFIRPRK